MMGLRDELNDEKFVWTLEFCLHQLWRCDVLRRRGMEDEQAKGIKKSSLCNATVEVPVRHPRRGAARPGGGSSLEVRERMTLCLPEPQRPCLDQKGLSSRALCSRESFPGPR